MHAEEQADCAGGPAQEAADKELMEAKVASEQVAGGSGDETEEDADDQFAWSSDEVEPIDDPPELWDRGVSIELLQDLLLDHELEGKTTREVIEDFVLPQTADYQCSLAGLMKRSFPETVGRATHYVVHPWDATFSRLVHALAAVDSEYTARGGGGLNRSRKALFWLDVFAIDQHLHAEGYGNEERLWLHRDELLLRMRSCIETIPITCVFMDPSHEPLVLQRSWCLYEVDQALHYRRHVLLMPCPEAPRVWRMLPAIQDFASAVRAFKVDFATSEAWLEQDRQWLQTAVTAAHPSGAAHLDENVGGIMRRWLAEEVLREMAEMEQAVPVKSLHDLGTLLEELADIGHAHSQFVMALELARDQLGTDHGTTLAISHDLACLQAKHFFKFEPAEELLWETLAAREVVLGNHHDVTNETVLALARLLQAQTRLDEAEELYRRALEHSLVEHGFAHRGTLVAANLLALLLQEKGELFEAYILLTRTLAVGMRVLGRKHYDVLVWRNNMAVLLQDSKDLERAESLFRKTLHDCEQALGTKHPHTLNVVFNLGQCLWQQDKLRAAEMLFRRELNGCKGTYGYGHRDTVRSVRNMIDFLEHQDRQEEALEYADLLAQIEAGDTDAEDGYSSSDDDHDDHDGGDDTRAAAAAAAEDDGDDDTGSSPERGAFASAAAAAESVDIGSGGGGGGKGSSTSLMGREGQGESAVEEAADHNDSDHSEQDLELLLLEEAAALAQESP